LFRDLWKDTQKADNIACLQGKPVAETGMKGRLVTTHLFEPFEFLKHKNVLPNQNQKNLKIKDPFPTSLFL
jgi:hypothetical protein